MLHGNWALSSGVTYARWSFRWFDGLIGGGIRFFGGAGTIASSRPQWIGAPCAVAPWNGTRCGNKVTCDMINLQTHNQAKTQILNKRENKYHDQN